MKKFSTLIFSALILTSIILIWPNMVESANGGSPKTSGASAPLPPVEYCCCDDNEFVCESPNLPCADDQSWVVKTDCSPAGGAGGTSDPQSVKLDNPLAGNVTDITVTFGKIVGAAIGVIGGLTLLMFVWGGFLWLTSAGNPERVKQGTQTMLWAAIGVILVFSSYLLLTTFMNNLRPGS